MLNEDDFLGRWDIWHPSAAFRSPRPRPQGAKEEGRLARAWIHWLGKFFLVRVKEPAPALNADARVDAVSATAIRSAIVARGETDLLPKATPAFTFILWSVIFLRGRAAPSWTIPPLLALIVWLLRLTGLDARVDIKRAGMGCGAQILVVALGRAGVAWGGGGGLSGRLDSVK